MDFLRSTTLEPQRVILLLTVANQGTTRLLLYRWDSWLSLTTVRPLRCSGQPLHAKDAFPHLLIPSCRYTSFAIVTGHEVVFYDDLTSKRMKRKEFQIPIEDQRSNKQWVQWAKPVRHEDHRKSKEDIILIREDGLLKTIVVSHNMDSRNSIAFEPGHLNINVDTAVCTLSAPPMIGGDILIACGDTTEGGVFHLAARKTPERLQTIPNWSPINDMIHLDYKSSSLASRDHGLVLAATGLYNQRAALTELRYGLEAEVEFDIKHDEGTTIDRLWTLERIAEGRLLLLASHHEHTAILCYDLHTGELASVDATVYPNLSFKTPTLAASTIPNDGLLQITTDQISVLGPAGQSCSRDLQSAEGAIVCADVHAASGVFVLAGRDGDVVTLLCGEVMADPPEIFTQTEAQQVAFVPVDLSLFELGGHGLCLVGSQDRQLHLFTVDPRKGCAALTSWSLTELDSRLDEPVISAVSVLVMPQAREALLICGLKTGSILLCGLKLPASESNGSVSLHHIQTSSIGTTAVSSKIEALPYTANERSAYVTCNTSLYRVQLHRSAAGLDFTFDALHFTNKNNPSYLPQSLNAVDRIGRLSSHGQGDPGGLLACVAGDEILLLGLGTHAMLPRPMRTMHHAKHLLYSPTLRRCIASHEGKLSSGSTPGRTIADRPLLQLYNTSSPSDVSSDLSRSSFHFGEKGEKIRVLLYWRPTDGEAHYDMIVIGSELGKDSHLSYLKVGRMTQTKAGPLAKNLATYPNKSISAICAFGESSLVVCAGRELKLLHLDVVGKRWQHLGTYELPSRATELKQKGSVIYAATSLHSFMLLRIEAGKFSLVGNDNYAGTARNIIPYGTSSTLINLISDHGSRLLNFDERPTRGVMPAFEATVPQAIDKMVQLSLPSASDHRDRFLGSTIDGTVYLFTTLTKAEMKLLHYLEHLSDPVRNQAEKSASLLAHAIAQKFANKLESAGITPPTMGATHARGDLLKSMLELGPYNIKRLLQKRVKLEDDDMIKEENEFEGLKDVAYPVLGATEHVVDGVILWLRRLLNVPAF